MIKYTYFNITSFISNTYFLISHLYILIFFRYEFEYAIEITYKTAHHLPIQKRDYHNENSETKRVSRDYERESDNLLESEEKVSLIITLNFKLKYNI
jgi:hypothetical protein